MSNWTSGARRAGLALAASAVALGLAGCDGAGSVASKAAGSGAPVAAAAVTGATVVEKEIAPTQEFSGRLEAVEQVNIRARVGGYLTAIHFQPGAAVRKGQLLFEIDPAPFQAEVDRSQAGLMAVRAEAELAQLELARARHLLAERAIAQREVDERTAALKKLDAQQRAAQAAFQAARLNLGYTRIEAPIAGRVSKAEVTRGNLIDPSVVLSSVVSDQQIYASFDGDEATFLRVGPAARRGAAVDVAVGLASERGFPHKGKLDFVDNRFERATGSVRMRAILANEDQMLVPGLFARVRLGGNLAAAGKAVLIDERAIGTDQSHKFVYVIGARQQAEYRAVTLGPVVDGLRVVREGLRAGENIVVDGLQRVKPGQALKAQMAAMEPGPRAALADATPAAPKTAAGALQ
ncbi:MAG TPA: efflux transporter periplasmic adaptor subunit [Janthinobacterium sp.]|nr:efflux transporter periplasmic adaptor subunit [Janthinobacterium sp.]